MPKAYSYFRFSSGSQAKGSTLDRQEKLVTGWLERNPDYELGELQFIDKGRSGYSGAHLKYDLGEILKAIEQGEISSGNAILVEAVDRIGRLPPTEMFDLILRITTAGVSIITVEDGQVYSKESLDSTTSSLFMLVGKVQQAHDYSKRLSDRVRAGYAAKREKAKAGEKITRLTPYWLTTSGELIEQRAEEVKDCITLYLKGYGTRKILQTLEEKHPKLKDKHPSTLVRWFKNRALAGDWAIYKAGDDPDNPRTSPSEIIKGVYPPLVDHATYYEIQAQLRSRSRTMGKAASYELSGLCKCGECGSNFHYRRKEYRGRVILYGNCSQYLKRGKNHCTNNKTWPYEVLLHIHNTTNDYHLQAASEIANEKAASKELSAKETERTEIRQEKSNLLVWLRKFPNDTQLESEYRNLLEQEEKLTIEMKALETHDSKPILTSFFEEAIEDSTMLNATLKEIGYQITVKHSLAFVDAGGALSKYRLLRRSQNHSCYIVHHQSLPEAVSELGLIESAEWDYQDCYLAIGHSGLIAAAPTDQALINTLNDRKSHNDIM